MKRLIKVFDSFYNIMNVLIPLSMDFDEVIYIYHHHIEQTQLNSCSEVLHKYKEKLIIDYRYIKNDEKEIPSLFNDDTTIDISTSKYLSAYLFEKALENKAKIIYYDAREETIKDYRKHKTIIEKVFSFSIEDVILLGGGKIIDKQMHEPININDTKTTKAIKQIVEDSFKNYSSFINYVQRINTFIAHRKINNTTYSLSNEIKNKIIHDPEYRKFDKYQLFQVIDNKLIFMNTTIRDLFSVSGSFLENYVYIKLNESKEFDQVLMSTIIDFSTYYNSYPIVCEVDCLAIRNNHLLFISCKSNKVDTDDLNEIKIHNTIFGNDLSNPVICTIEDLNVSSALEYLKARELKISIIDKTSFIKGKLVEDLLSIVNKTYKYERV